MRPPPDVALPADRAEPGRGVRATWYYTLGSLVFFVVVLAFGVLSAAARLGGSAWGAVDWAFAAAVVLGAGLACRFCFGLHAGLGAGFPRWRPVAWLVAPAVAAWLVSLADPELALLGALPLWLAASCLAVPAERGARKAVLVASLVLVAVHPVLAASVHGTTLAELGLARPALLFPAFYLLMLPALFIGSIWWWDVVVQLDASRRESSQLAIARERLRFAADLHDIQGHHLQVIALKAELAGRLMESQPVAARQQIDEAQELARTALEDTRALAHGYRHVDFADEVRNAADVLGAAGITCRVSVDDAGLAGPTQKVLGLVIREATTNILRHSEASRASFDLHHDGRWWVLDIVNDGVAPGAGPRTGDGSGLAGLRGRLVDQDGRLQAGTDGDQFKLHATLPLATAVAP